jgi:hypothetical protein
MTLWTLKRSNAGAGAIPAEVKPTDPAIPQRTFRFVTKYAFNATHVSLLSLATTLPICFRWHRAICFVQSY